MIWNNDGQFESNKAYSFGGSPYQPCIYLHSGSRALKMLHVSTSSIPTVRAALVTCMSWPPKTTDTNNCTYAHICRVYTRARALSVYLSHSFAHSFCVQLCIMYMQNFNFRSFAVKWLHRWKSNRHRTTISKKEKDRDGDIERKKKHLYESREIKRFCMHWI